MENIQHANHLLSQFSNSKKIVELLQEDLKKSAHHFERIKKEVRDLTPDGYVVTVTFKRVN